MLLQQNVVAHQFSTLQQSAQCRVNGCAGPVAECRHRLQCRTLSLARARGLDLLLHHVRILPGHGYCLLTTSHACLPATTSYALLANTFMALMAVETPTSYFVSTQKSTALGCLISPKYKLTTNCAKLLEFSYWAAVVLDRDISEEAML